MSEFEFKTTDNKDLLHVNFYIGEEEEAVDGISFNINLPGGLNQLHANQLELGNILGELLLAVKLSRREGSSLEAAKKKVAATVDGFVEASNTAHKKIKHVNNN